MLNQLIIVLSYLNSASLLIPIGIGLYRRKAMTPALWMSWAALVAYLLLFLVSFITAKSGIRVNNLLITYLISGLFGGFFAIAYWLIVTGWRKKVIGGLGILGIIGTVIEAFVQGKYTEVSQWSVPLQTVLTTLISLIFLHILLRQTRVSLLTVPFFWITGGLLISSVLGTFYDAFRHAMLASSRDLLMLWLCFQLAVTILCNVLYAVGFNRAKRGQ
jgi:hypothetical protein